MTPGVLAEAAKTLAGRKVKVTVLERRDAEREGMASYLSVARGSEEPPKFIVLEYKGARESRQIALIGKSITFDSGGIS
ncbi:MAG: M17 family metallopeptidase [Desulfobacterales bacterium]|nr:M17 family metallopeptidase [Desulfobacterales bacterium]